MSWNPIQWLQQQVNPPVQGPKLTKSQQALQDWRAHRAGVVQSQVQADQAAGAKATRAYEASKGAPKGAVTGARLPAGGGTAAGAVKNGLLAAPIAYALNYVGQKGVDAAVPHIVGGTTRLLDATVGLKKDGKDVDYNTQTGKLEYARPQASGTKITINGKTYDTGYHAKEIAALRKQNPGGGNAAQSQSTDPSKPAYVAPGGNGGNNGRQTPAPDGGSGTGTNTGFKGADVGMANSLLESLGISTVKYGQFESNDYAGSQDPTEKESKTDTDAKLTGQNVGAYVGSGASPTNEEELPTPDTNIVNTGAGIGGAVGGSVELSADSTKKGPALGSRRRAAQEFLADRPNMRPGDNESLVGLRASDASKGLLYASGKYWQEDGNGGFTEISKADYKTIKRGDQHAQQFARDKIELVKAIDTESDLVVDDSGATVKDYGVSEADYPEATAYDPNEGEDFEKTSRMQNLVDRKEKGDFDQFVKDNNITY